MTDPRIELIAAKSAVCSGAATTLDVLIRVTPPRPDVHFLRPPLNLGLVLDRSGSMAGGRKMAFALEAAAFAVEQLMPTDRVSVTTFDNEVETIVPNALATNKPDLVRRIRGVAPRGSTNLHGGWAEGARQVEAHRTEQGINRVLLLSDGLANVGVTDPNAIAAEARGLAARGVSTTTLGVGDDYNEDLMEMIANAGDGRYYFIESPAQLVDIYQTELTGLMATLGEKVSLGLETRDGATVSEVLNDYERVATGRLKLPNLIVGMPVLAVVRLNVPPRSHPLSPLEVRLAWDDPRAQGRRTLRVALDALPALPLAEWSRLPDNFEVSEQAALLIMARAQKEAGFAAQRGDHGLTMTFLNHARSSASTIMGSPMIEDELRAIDAIEAALQAGDHAHSGKLAKFRSYQRRNSQSPLPPGPKDNQP